MDTRNEKIGYKIREAQAMKIPYMLVLGAKEQESGEISVRHRKNGDLGAMNVEAFIARCHDEISRKTME